MRSILASRELWWVAAAFLVGVLGIGVGFLITSTLPQFDDSPGAESAPQRSQSVAEAGIDEEPSPRRIFVSCMELAAKQSRAAVAADTSLDQWHLHIEAMNQLVSGEITLDQANQYWERTRIDAKQNAKHFMRAYHSSHHSRLGCDSQGLPPETPTWIHHHVDRCHRAVQTLDELLHSSRTAVMTWMHHIRDMNAMRAGRITAAQATAMWIAKWHKGARQLHEYSADAEAASKTRCA